MSTLIRRCSAICILVLLAFAFQASAATEKTHGTGLTAESPMLLTPWCFGLTMEDALHLPNAKAGEGEFAGDVMIPEADFAGLNWTARLEFRENRLVRVSLMHAYVPARLEAVNTALKAMGFEMLAMLAGDSRLDFVASLKTQGVDALRQRIDALADKEHINRRAWAWFDTKKVSREMKVMVRNLNELLQMVSADTREAEVTLLGDTGSPTHILVDFSLPILELQTFGK